MSTENKIFEGDVAVSGGAAVGGDAVVRGGAKIAGTAEFSGNVKIAGTLDAKNVRGPQRGLFVSAESLNAAWPKPQEGWCALVETEESKAGKALGQLYAASGGSWIAQKNADGTPALVSETCDYYERVDALETKNADQDTAIEKVKSDLAAAKTAMEEYDEAILQRVYKVEAAAAENAMTIDAVAGNIEQTDKRITAAEERITAAEESVKTLRESVTADKAEQDGRLDKAEERLTAAEQANAQEDTKISAVEKTLAEATGNVTTLRKRLATLPMLPFDGVKKSAGENETAVYYDESAGAFKGNAAAYTAKGLTAGDYNGTDGKARTGRLYVCGDDLYIMREDGVFCRLLQDAETLAQIAADCETAADEAKTAARKAEESVAACAAKNEKQDERLDAVEEEDKTLRKRSDALAVLPFDGLMAGTAEGLLFDAENKIFVSKGKEDAFAAKGYEEADYNKSGETKIALTGRLYLYNGVLYEFDGETLAEYAVRPSEVGAKNGVAPLDEDCLVPYANTRSGVLEFSFAEGTISATYTTDKLTSRSEECDVAYGEISGADGAKGFALRRIAGIGKYEYYCDWADAARYGVRGVKGRGQFVVSPRDNVIFVEHDTRKLYYYNNADGGLIEIAASAAAGLQGVPEIDLSTADWVADEDGSGSGIDQTANGDTAVRKSTDADCKIVYIHKTDGDTRRLMLYYYNEDEADMGYFSDWEDAADFGEKDGSGAVMPSERALYRNTSDGALYRYAGGEFTRVTSTSGERVPRVMPFQGFDIPARGGSAWIWNAETKKFYDPAGSRKGYAGYTAAQYNDTDGKLYLYNGRIYVVRGGVMSEYAPAATAGTPVFKVLYDAGEKLSALPTATTDKTALDGEVCYAPLSSGTGGTLVLQIYNEETKAYDNYITWADADEYGALNSDGARVPRSDVFFVNAGSGVIMYWPEGGSAFVNLSGGTAALEKIAQFQHLTDNLGVYPFDGTLPAADGARGIFFDAENGCFTAVGSYADGYTNYFHKGFAATDYNGSDGKAIEGRLFRCGSVLYQVKDGKLQEYCAEEKEEIETLRKRSDTLRILPFDGEMTDADTDASGLMFNLTSKKFVTMGADDAFAAKGYKEADYNETDTEGNVSPVAANLYVCGSTLYKVESGTLAEYGGGTDETLRKRVAGIKILPVDGIISTDGTATAESGVLYDTSNHKFVSKGDEDAFAAHGYAESDYNETVDQNNAIHADFVKVPQITIPRISNLYAYNRDLYRCDRITEYHASERATYILGAAFSSVHSALETKITAVETKNTEQDTKIAELEAALEKEKTLIRLYSEEGGKVLVDGYNVTLPAGELKCVHALSSFKTNGTACSLIDVSHLNTEGWTSFAGMFENFTGKTLDLTALNWESVKDSTDMFKNCPMLYDLQLGKGWHPTSGAVLDFTGVPNWTVESLQTNLVTNSTDWGGGLRGTANVLLDINAYDHLTDEDLTTLTNKGYIVQSLDGTDENRTENLWWADEIKDE